jgi:anti-sigma factor RsiW
MNCAAIENLLDLYAEKRLSAGMARRVAAHLKSCEACSGEAHALDALKAGPKTIHHAPKSLLHSLEKLSAGPAPGPLQEETLTFTPVSAAPVFAVVAAYAGLLLLLGIAGPGVPTQQFETHALEALP